MHIGILCMYLDHCLTCLPHNLKGMRILGESHEKLNFLGYISNALMKKKMTVHRPQKYIQRKIYVCMPRRLKIFNERIDCTEKHTFSLRPIN